MYEEERLKEGAEIEAGERKGVEGTLFDLARKTVVASVRTILTSEDGIKALIGAIVPKEVGQTVLREIATLRTEAVRAFVAEMARYLERLDLAREAQKILSGLRFDVHVRIEVNTIEENSSKASRNQRESEESKKQKKVSRRG